MGDPSVFVPVILLTFFLVLCISTYGRTPPPPQEKKPAARTPRPKNHSLEAINRTAKELAAIKRNQEKILSSPAYRRLAEDPDYTELIQNIHVQFRGAAVHRALRMMRRLNEPEED